MNMNEGVLLLFLNSYSFHSFNTHRLNLPQHHPFSSLNITSVDVHSLVREAGFFLGGGGVYLAL